MLVYHVSFVISAMKQVLPIVDRHSADSGILQNVKTKQTKCDPAVNLFITSAITAVHNININNRNTERVNTSDNYAGHECCYQQFSWSFSQWFSPLHYTSLKRYFSRTIAVVQEMKTNSPTPKSNIISFVSQGLSLIHIWRCRRSTLCRSRWSPYH